MKALSIPASCSGKCVTLPAIIATVRSAAKAKTSSLITFLSSAAAAATVIGICIDADIIAAVSAVLALAGAYTLDTKGGAE